MIDTTGTMSFMAARDCAVRDCAISHIGSYGIEIAVGCRQIEISGNRLYDLGTGGVKVHGGEVDEAVWRRTGEVSIHDNQIERGGRVFPAGVGVLLGCTFENVVAHNSIHDFFYTGISVGWSWGYRETISRDNLIYRNRITRIGQGLISDMGAIYTLGVQPGTVISGNFIHDVAANDYGSWGVYLDEGSSHIEVFGNWVSGTQGPCVNIHFGRRNSIRANVLIASDDACMSIGRVDMHEAAHFRENIIVSLQDYLYRCGYSGLLEHGLVSDDNLFFVHRPVSVAVRYDREPFSTSWEAWIRARQDMRSSFEYLNVEGLERLSDPRELGRALGSRAGATANHASVSEWARAGVRSDGTSDEMRQPLTRAPRVDDGYRE